MIACTVTFSLLGAAWAVAGGAVALGVLRYLAAISLAGVLPLALALVAEHAPTRRESTSTAVLILGHHIGAVAAPPILFVLGAVLVLVLVTTKLPAATTTLAASPSTGDARSNAFRELGRGGLGRATLASWMVSSPGLLVYGLDTWLPIVVRQAGYPLAAALLLLLVLIVSAVVGQLAGGRVSDSVGGHPPTVRWFLAPAAFLGQDAPVRGRGVRIAAIGHETGRVSERHRRPSSTGVRA